MGSSLARQAARKAAKQEAAAVRVVTELEKRQGAKLAYWQRELKWRGRTLQRTSASEPTLCWELLIDELPEARQLGLEDTLRALVWEAAGRFANPSMLRSGMRYYRQGEG